MSSEQNSRPTKLCFVTVGATASFNALVQEVLEMQFLEELYKHNYTDLLIQYGQHGELHFRNFIENHGQYIKDKYGIYVTGFDFNYDGLKEEIIAVRANPSYRRSEGVVLSHSGSGTILEVMRYDVPLVVVPNPDLMNNHQEELADQLEFVGYALHGRLGSLASILEKTEQFRPRLHSWPPAINREHGIAEVMDDELGFVD